MLEVERMNNKKYFVVFVGFLLFLNAYSAEAAWWNPFPCVNDCIEGQLDCREDHQSAWRCGDYDTLADFDRCLEFPPKSNQDAVQDCPFGCIDEVTGQNYQSIDLGGWPGIGTLPWSTFGPGDICMTTDPCASGESCQPGDSRCGRKCPEARKLAGLGCKDTGDWIEASFFCKKAVRGGTELNCYEFVFDDINARECPFGCDFGSGSQPGSGKCLDQNQRDLSTCVPSISECDESRFYVRECVDENLDGVYHLEEDANDMTFCPHGCAEDYSIDGMAYCKDKGGAIDCNQCLFGGTRCNPNNEQYMQWCWEQDAQGCSKWTTDYSRFTDKFGDSFHRNYGQHCPFGCHLGKCRANPEPDVPNLDACSFEGETTCAGDNSYVKFCEKDAQGTLVWGNRKKCLSGKCVNRACVVATGKGFDQQTLGFPTNEILLLQVYGMSGDSNRIYVAALTDIVGILGNRNTLITFDGNFSYRKHCFLNDTDIVTGSGVTSITDTLYMTSAVNELTILDDDCVNSSTISLNRNASSTGFLTNNGTHFFIRANTTDGLNVYDISGNYQYSICLIEDTKTFCRDNQNDIVFLDDRLYLTSQENSVASLETYGTTGYYFGEENLTVPTGFTASTVNIGLSGITAIGDKLYMIWTRIQTSIPNFLISVYFLDSSCRNTCNENGSRCAGFNKEYVSQCVETPNGCFKYFDEVQNLYPGTQFDVSMQNCGATQCKEYWENHFVLKAFCDQDVSCEDVCELGQNGCDSFRTAAEVAGKWNREGLDVADELANKFTGSRYRVKCILKDSPVPFNLGRKCFGWADPFDAQTNSSLYEFCGQSRTCVDGECIIAPNDCSENETHCEVRGDLEFVVPCGNVLERLTWSWGNRTECEGPCFESFSITTNKRTGECLAKNSSAWITTTLTKNAVAEFEQWWNILWPDPLSQLFIVLCLSVAAFALLARAGWQIGVGGGLAVFLGHLSTGWIGSWFLFGVLAVLGIVFLPKLIRGGGGDD